jgi:hypothetical protein
MSQFTSAQRSINGVSLTLADVKAQILALSATERASTTSTASNTESASAVRPPPVIPTVPDTLGLKARASQLVHEITDWLVLVSNDAPNTDVPFSADEIAKTKSLMSVCNPNG